MDEKFLKKLRVDPEQLARLTPAEYAEVQQELLALERLHRENPLLGYEPHDKQVVFHSPPFPRSRLFLGGNRSGKTTASMVDTILQACDRDVVPQHLQQYKRWEPPFYARVVIPRPYPKPRGRNASEVPGVVPAWATQGKEHGSGLGQGAAYASLRQWFVGAVHVQ